MHIRSEALGDCDGSVQFNHNSITSKSTETNNTVPIRQGKSIIEEGTPQPTVIKIDCEGAEKLILDGLEDYLDDIRLAYIEPHYKLYSEFGTSWDAIETQLHQHGFETKWIEADCVHNLLRAEKSSL